ncbi:zinc finger protein 316 [Ixodes scapularis]|uniref:zinc finger protein 316 n=1 Tax=Ixodes scapularis TaxID=6945 RepID=UPI001C38A9A4|nr:zinc finger protein 316 [Ixodes scapularis]
MKAPYPSRPTKKMDGSSDESTHEVSDESKVNSRNLQCDGLGCNYRTNRISDLKRHVSDKHDALTKPQICCGQELKDRWSLDLHRDLVHRRAGIGPPTYKCPLCASRFPRKSLLVRHMCVHNGKKLLFRCDICAYGTSHKSNLKYHKATRHDTMENDSGIGTGHSDHSRPGSAGSGIDVPDDHGCGKAGPIRGPPGNGSISALDLQEAGPSGIQGKPPAARAMVPRSPGRPISLPESPPTARDDDDDEDPAFMQRGRDGAAHAEHAVCPSQGPRGTAG